jgi:hypothetical protein
MNHETGNWYPASSADNDHDDIEIDLGNGWWACVVAPGNTWTWFVCDQWLADEFSGDYSVVHTGEAESQKAAMAAALDAYRTNGA